MSPKQDESIQKSSSEVLTQSSKVSGITLQWHHISKTVDLSTNRVHGKSSNVTKKIRQSFSFRRSIARNGFNMENKKCILNNISGSARVGEVLSLMGPSGSGKTSLLDVLSGRSSHDTMNGSINDGSMVVDHEFSGITINGEIGTPVTLKKLRRRIAYVKQQDIFFQHLTVRDQLMFTAMLRLPKPKLNKTATSSREFYECAVNNIISLLRLEKCEDSIIQIISGGERKRVNIGTELLTDPSVIILDEPTSGLDSTSAVSLMKMLKRLARDQNKTVISSIHQPSSAVFMELFDKIMMLAEGHVVFYGSPSKSLEYLENIGLMCPSGYNAADHWMDILVSTNSAAGNVSVDRNSNDVEGQETRPIICTRQKLIESWDNDSHSRQVVAYDDQLRANLMNVCENGENLDGFDADESEVDTLNDSISKYGSSWSKQLIILMKRSLKNSRAAVFTWLNFVKSGLIGIVMGLLWFQMDYTEQTVNDRSAYYFFTMTFWVFDAMFMAL